MIALFRDDKIIDFPQKPAGKSNEWFTPHKYIEAAREVMGGIDLDPASCVEANEIVKAKRYYTQQQDGLQQSWQAESLWLNPPYGKVNNKSTIDIWIRRLISEYRMATVNQAILLTTCDSDNQWFQLLWDYPICFTNHNVHFFKPDSNGKISKDSRSTQMFGTVFTYLGPHEQKFIDVFQKFGTIAKRVSDPRHEARQVSLWEGAE